MSCTFHSAAQLFVDVRFRLDQNFRLVVSSAVLLDGRQETVERRRRVEIAIRRSREAIRSSQELLAKVRNAPIRLWTKPEK